ncbi:carboxypeptidase-like regulatory domain-containing protein [Nocardioides caricicola]|uniref:Carboxypeptidase-like regulatory domain-containing protein n=1 Tax=Nocardioides caricicola TaxID=634770 RepID=A0ABW0N1N2_9ACTN
MSWLRTTAALLTGAVLLVPQVLPASASTTHSALPAAPAAKVSPVPLVQGVVADQFGNFVDGVMVRATKGGTAVASAETYASKRASGPQHGYFFLEVGKPGTYTVTLSKKGYETVTFSGIEVKRPRQKVSLGAIEIEKTPEPTTTSAALVSRSVTTKARGAVVVKVAAKATKSPVGEVEIREGDKVVGSADLRASGRGTVTVVLGKLGKGGHVLKAHFLGSDTLAPSASKQAITLVVVKARK